MADPISLVAIGAAVGGASGKFVERAWDSGERWLKSYFADHHEKAQEKGQENSLSFLSDLSRRLESLEQQGRLSPEKIATAQEHPDFSVVLQKAMLSAAQTDNNEKHKLLSRLVAERISSKPESLLALASKMACDAISYTTTNQLRLLGIVVNLLYISPTAEMNQEQYARWLQARLGAFIGTTVNNMDYLHLESLSCLKVLSFVGRDLKSTLAKKNNDKFDYESFKITDLGCFLVDIWDKQKLHTVELTSIGQIIGIMVTDQMAGASTNMSVWE